MAATSPSDPVGSLKLPVELIDRICGHVWHGGGSGTDLELARLASVNRTFRDVARRYLYCSLHVSLDDEAKQGEKAFGSKYQTALGCKDYVKRLHIDLNNDTLERAAGEHDMDRFQGLLKKEGSHAQLLKTVLADFQHVVKLEISDIGRMAVNDLADILLTVATKFDKLKSLKLHINTTTLESWSDSKDVSEISLSPTSVVSKLRKFSLVMVYRTKYSVFAQREIESGSNGFDDRSDGSDDEAEYQTQREYGYPEEDPYAEVTSVQFLLPIMKILKGVETMFSNVEHVDFDLDEDLQMYCRDDIPPELLLRIPTAKTFVGYMNKYESGIITVIRRESLTSIERLQLHDRWVGGILFWLQMRPDLFKHVHTVSLELKFVYSNLEQMQFKLWRKDATKLVAQYPGIKSLEFRYGLLPFLSIQEKDIFSLAARGTEMAILKPEFRNSVERKSARWNFASEENDNYFIVSKI